MAGEQNRKSWKGKHTKQEKYRRSWAALPKFLDELVKLAPSYKDSRKGRAKATQLRIVELLIGLGIITFGGQSLLFLGVFVMSLILFVPVTELRKRELRARLKRARFGTRPVTTDVELGFDGRRFELNIDQKMDRRVLLNKSDHRFEEASINGKQLLVIKGPDNKKKSHIWITSPDAAEENGNTQGYAPEDTDILVEVRSADFEDILQTLMGDDR